MTTTGHCGGRADIRRCSHQATRDFSLQLEMTGLGRAGLLSSIFLAVTFATTSILGWPIRASAAATPVVPAPAECTVAPRQVPATGGGAPTAIVTAVAPLPAPFTPPAGSPAAADAVTASSTTIREAIACANAGDVERSLALLSDRAFAAYLSGPNALDRGMLQLTSGTPAPAATADQLALVSIDGVTRLSDGRIGATVVTRNRLATYTDYIILVFEHNRWVIDESVPISTMPAATPAATP